MDGVIKKSLLSLERFSLEWQKKTFGFAGYAKRLALKNWWNFFRSKTKTNHDSLAHTFSRLSRQLHVSA